MLDKIAPYWRHLIIMLVPALIAWAVQAVPQWNIPVSLAALIGIVLTTLGLWFTSATRQYGAGKAQEGEVNVGE